VLESFIAAAQRRDLAAMLAHFDEQARSRQRSMPDAIPTYFARLKGAWVSQGVTSTRMLFAMKNGQMDARGSLTLAFDLEAKAGNERKTVTFELVRNGEDWFMTDAYFGEAHDASASPPPAPDVPTQPSATPGNRV